MIEPVRARMHCGVCGQPGHNARTCSGLPVPDANLTAIAELRERMDALGAELLEYERVRDVVNQRIAADRAEIAQLSIDIARLRRGAT